MAGAPAMVDFVRDSNGVGLPSLAVEVRKKAVGDGEDNALVFSATTDASGRFAGDETTLGYSGPVRYTASGSGVTRVHSSESIGIVGAFRMSDLPRMFRMMTDGPLDGLDGELAVTASGAGMTVSVASGGAYGYGLFHYWPVARAVAIASNASGNPRVDLIVLRFWPPGTLREGKQELAVVQGTPAASPVAPALTQSPTGVWEVPLAEVRVENGAASITADKVTDRRVFTSGPLHDGSVTFAKIASAALGGGATQLARGDHAHLAEATRGYLRRGKAQGGADNATSTTTFQDAISLSVVLPPGTWTVRAEGGLELDGNGGSMDRRCVIGAVNGTAVTNNAASGGQWFEVDQEATGQSGTVVVRVQHRRNGAGSGSARTPRLYVSAWRSA